MVKVEIVVNVSMFHPRTDYGMTRAKVGYHTVKGQNILVLAFMPD